MPSLFQSISSFFSSSSSRQHFHIRRDQAMSSIDDAFSIPPDTEYVSSNSVYTYPPPAQGGSYDSFSQSNYDHHAPLSPASSSKGGSRARPPPLLPLHHAPLSPLPHYPPLQQTWARLRNWLDRHYPELGDTLNWGLPAPELAQLELELDIALPPAVRDSYLLVDGQEPESAAGCSEGLFFGLTLLPFEDVLDEWRFWRAVDDDPATGANPALCAAMSSVPPGWIRREYSQRGWLPLVADKAGNYLGVDMNPDERGVAGQVIVFGRDFDTKVVMWNGSGEGGWARWLTSFVDELESGEGFEVGGAGDGSEGSEDDVGYESYFFDGSAGKGEGGGEGGRGGLRLTGEYRGWPVLEALADRSMKRWVEAGVMAQPTPTPAAAKPHAIDMGLHHTSEPSVSSKTDDSSTSTGANGDPTTSYVPPAPGVPQSKVPAPLPVVLPTEQDIIPSPTFFSPIDAALVYDQDEETGSLSMREIDLHTTPVQANFNSSVKEAMLVPLSSSDRPVHVRQPTDSLVTESQALLVDSVHDLESPAVQVAHILPSTALGPLSSDPLTEGASPAEDISDMPQPTVRLVGGGVTASLVDDVSDSEKKLALGTEESSGRSAKRKTEVA